MAVSFTVLPAHGVVYVRYRDRMTIEESGAAFSAYLTHPDYRPGQKQLVDLRQITEWEQDFPQLLALQAKKAEALHDPLNPTLVISLASTDFGLTVADFMHRSWDDVDGVVCRVARTEAEALDLLGLAVDSIASLVAAE